MKLKLCEIEKTVEMSSNCVGLKDDNEPSRGKNASGYSIKEG